MSRIKVFAAAAEDFDDYYRIRCEPSDIYWMGHSSAPDRQMLFSIFLERVGPKTLSVVGDKVIYMAKNDNDETVGFALLSLTDSGIEIGISLFQVFQGLGFGSEIISEIVMVAKEYNRSLYAQIRDDNIASQRIFLKNGFMRTGQFEMRDFPKAGRVAFRTYTLPI